MTMRIVWPIRLVDSNSKGSLASCPVVVSKLVCSVMLYLLVRFLIRKGCGSTPDTVNGNENVPIQGKVRIIAGGGGGWDKTAVCYRAVLRPVLYVTVQS